MHPQHCVLSHKMGSTKQYFQNLTTKGQKVSMICNTNFFLIFNLDFNDSKMSHNEKKMITKNDSFEFSEQVSDCFKSIPIIFFYDDFLWHLFNLFGSVKIFWNSGIHNFWMILIWTINHFFFQNMKTKFPIRYDSFLNHWNQGYNYL